MIDHQAWEQYKATKRYKEQHDSPYPIVAMTTGCTVMIVGALATSVPVIGVGAFMSLMGVFVLMWRAFKSL